MGSFVHASQCLGPHLEGKDNRGPAHRGPSRSIDVGSAWAVTWWLHCGQSVTCQLQVPEGHHVERENRNISHWGRQLQGVLGFQRKEQGPACGPTVERAPARPLG